MSVDTSSAGCINAVGGAAPPGAGGFTTFGRTEKCETGVKEQRC